MRYSSISPAWLHPSHAPAQRRPVRRPAGHLAHRLALGAGHRTLSRAVWSLVIVATGAACGAESGTVVAPYAASSRMPSGRYASPTGSASGDGSAARPWDLATALAGPGTVIAGDTLWLRGGRYHGCYTSELTGSADARVVVQQFPGEHATLDNAGCTDPALVVHGSYTDFRGFEVTNSAPYAGGPQGIDAFGDEIRLINLVVHDAAGSGIGFWKEGAGGEIYGSILYNNGRTFNLDHGIYSQNAAGTKRIADNVVFDSWAFGVHVHGSDAAPITGYTIEGNALFANGSIGENGSAPNLLVGGGTPASRVIVRDNYLYGPPDGTGNMWLGYEARNADLVLRNNVVVGGDPALRLWYWSSVSASANVFARAASMVDVRGGAGGMRWDGASFYASPDARAWKLDDARLTLASWLARTGFRAGPRTSSSSTVAPVEPSGTWVFVRPNAYEAGRGHVIVYDWSGGSAPVLADVSSILRPGDRYEVRPVERVLDAPVLTGTYAGAALSLPMTPVTPPSPIGGAAAPAPSTRPTFGVFLITLAP